MTAKFKHHSKVNVPFWLKGDVWTDNSYQHDTCPKVTFFTELKHEGTTYDLNVWVNYPKPAQRECKGSAPFVVEVYDVDKVSSEFHPAGSANECRRLVNDMLEKFGREERV